jgi:hypothetical protein
MVVALVRAISPVGAIGIVLIVPGGILAVITSIVTTLPPMIVPGGAPTCD